MTHLTHDDRRERRAAIAAAVESGQAAADAAIEWGVSVGLVHQACREHGVSLRTIQSGTTLEILARLLNTQDCLHTIATDLGVKFSRVRSVLQLARRAGIRVMGR